MKIPYVQDSSEGLSPEDAAIYERIKLRRGGSLLPLDKALFHSPKLADGEFWTLPYFITLHFESPPLFVLHFNPYIYSSSHFFSVLFVFNKTKIQDGIPS